MTDRIRQVRDRLEPARDCFDPDGIESEPVDQGRAQILDASLGEIERVGGQNLGRALAQESRRGMKRAVLRLRRRVGELTRRGARLKSEFAHGGADVGFGLFDLDGDGHDGGTGLFTLNLADEARFRHDFPSSHAFGRNAWQYRGLVSSRAPPMRSMQ